MAEERLSDCNRDVIAARLAVAAAEADLRTASQRPNPTLTLEASNVNPSAGVGAGPLRGKTFDSAARIDQLIERGSKAELRMAQAQALLDAAKADVAEQARQQRLAMRTAFFDLAAAQERVRLQLEFRDLSTQSADASSQRMKAGEVSRAEANRFRLDAARAANDARQAQSDRERSRLDLAKLLGMESAASTLDVRIEWPRGEESCHDERRSSRRGGREAARGCGARRARARAQHRHARRDVGTPGRSLADVGNQHAGNGDLVHVLRLGAAARASRERGRGRACVRRLRHREGRIRPRAGFIGG